VGTPRAGGPSSKRTAGHRDSRSARRAATPISRASSAVIITVLAVALGGIAIGVYGSQHGGLVPQGSPTPTDWSFAPATAERQPSPAAVTSPTAEPATPAVPTAAPSRATPLPTVSGQSTAPSASAIAQPVMTPGHPTPADLAFGRSLGPETAPVHLDLWADFQCPACQVFALLVEPALVKSYIQQGDVRLTFHDLEFLGPESLGAAMSARCADRQGRFWAYHDLLYTNQGPENSGWFTRDRALDFARALRLDTEAFSACLDDPTIQADVEAETRQGFGLGVKETPTLFLDGAAVTPVNNWQAVSGAIDAALARSRQSASP
jgi:protein-disulfide isomerase